LKALARIFIELAEEQAKEIAAKKQARTKPVKPSRSDVGEQEALPAVDPQQVQVPVLGRRGRCDERGRPGTEEGEHLRRAAEDHRRGRFATSASQPARVRRR
jgi:hypothetical protein